MGAKWSWNAMAARERRGEPLWGVKTVATVDLVPEVGDLSRSGPVVIRKRDSKEKRPMSKLKKILKSEVRPTRDVFAEAVRREAVRLNKRESELWRDELLQQYYEDCPLQTPVPTSLRKSALDAAEALQVQFEAIRKSSPGLSVNECYDAALEALEPSTRGQYLAEILKAHPLPDVEEEEDDGEEDDADEQDDDTQDDDTGHHQIQDRESTGRYKRKRKCSDEEGVARLRGKADTACPACGSDSVAPGDRYCARCGTDLSKRAKRRATA